MIKIKVVESGAPCGPPHQFAISYIVNDVVAIDAGCLGFLTPLDAQSRVEHVFLSHSHLDHIASLPIFLDNVYSPDVRCPTVHANQATLDALRDDFFNDRVWPDLERLAKKESPFLRMETLAAEQAVEACGLLITPVALDHVVPTLGFVIADDESAVAIVSDTGPTKRIWEVLNAMPRLSAVLLEASFPNSMAWLARESMHLTPELFRGQARNLNRKVPLLAVHLKPAYRDQLVLELTTLGLETLQIAVPGREYEF